MIDYLIPIETIKDMDGLGGYSVVEKVTVKGRTIYSGNIVDRRDMTMLAEPPFEICMRTKEGYHTFMQEAATKSVKKIPKGANAFLINQIHKSRDKIPACWVQLRSINISNIRRFGYCY